MMKAKFLAAAVAVTMAMGVGAGAAMAADGAKVFKKRCKSCHTVTAGKHKVGPSLAGVMGRKAGTAEGYTKYKGLKGADFSWNEENMDKWLTNPKKFLGKKTSMGFKLKKAKERTAVIEYLKAN